MGIGIHSQNLSANVVPLTATIASKDHVCQNAYGKGGTLIFTTLGSTSNQQITNSLVANVTVAGFVTVSFTSSITGLIKFAIELGVGNTGTELALLTSVALNAMPSFNTNYTASAAGADIIIEANVLAVTDEFLNCAFTNSSELEGFEESRVSTPTSSAGAINCTVEVLGLDPYSKFEYSLLTSTAITAVGSTMLQIHPELVAAANSVAATLLPREFIVRLTMTSTDAMAYMVTLNSNI